MEYRNKISIRFDYSKIFLPGQQRSIHWANSVALSALRPTSMNSEAVCFSQDPRYPKTGQHNFLCKDSTTSFCPLQDSYSIPRHPVIRIWCHRIGGGPRVTSQNFVTASGRWGANQSGGGRPGQIGFGFTRATSISARNTVTPSPPSTLQSIAEWPK